MGSYAARVENKEKAIFKGPTGSLRIGVERYQFPEITDGYWDTSWLIITGDAVVNGQSWSFRDPCLITFEMERLATDTSSKAR